MEKIKEFITKHKKAIIGVAVIIVAVIIGAVVF